MPVSQLSLRPMKTMVLHPGTQHSRQTALALQELGQLHCLLTGLFDHPGSTARSLIAPLPANLRKPFERELSRFASAGLDPTLVRSEPRFELPERIATRLGAPRLGRSIDAVLNASFGRYAARIAQREGPLVLWGFDDSAFAAFSDARTKNCPKVLDRTIADWRCWNEEIERIGETHGDWLAGDLPAMDGRKIARNDIEYENADRIVCGSPFVAQSILDYSPVPGLAGKLVQLPYTYDARLFAGAPTPRRTGDGEPVKFLFAGQVSARKGIHHLMEAIERLPRRDARLTVVGPVSVPERLLSRYCDRVEILGPVTRSEMPAIMQAHHALVFPSHFEGSAIVLIEAMASGLAIIQSAAAGLGASEDSGIVLERPDADRLEAAMLLLVRDRDRLHEMRLAAMKEATQRDFTAYRDGIAQLLDGMGV